MDILQLVKVAVKAADDKKASNLMVLDIRKSSAVTDYFVISTGSSTTQTKAIADNIEEKLEEENALHLLRREGYSQGSWILLDYGSIVVHIFKPDEREFYKLERLWGDAEVLDVLEMIGD